MTNEEWLLANGWVKDENGQWVPMALPQAAETPMATSSGCCSVGLKAVVQKVLGKPS